MVDPVRVALLTGGGDCPGLNAVIRAIVRRGGAVHGDDFIGFLDAWNGVLDNSYVTLDKDAVRGLLPRGGTILGTRRGGPFDHPNGPERVKETLANLGVDALVVIGGEGSLTVASRLHNEYGVNVVGVPKTIDNDIVGTDVCFGFHTAVQIATDAIDRLHTTAESHDRVMVVEVMGRNSGWIATYAGAAGGATVTLVPEEPFSMDDVISRIANRHAHGRYASIVVVAEGAGSAAEIAPVISERTGFEVRVVQIGHVQRGGTPTAYDRMLATRYGLAAIDAVHDKAWGTMVALQNTVMTRVPLSIPAGKQRPVDTQLVDLLKESFLG
jgi:6-phosphofructokinase 1